jgi:glycosyltransferase involved in cell wall biosynthesis
MPVYNAERYLDEAVQSVLDQSFKDFEFIIIDDGSTDGSLKILQGYQSKDARIRLISRPNTGHCIALNEMVLLARGEFIARMDSDDISLPDRFEHQLAFLRSNPDVVAVGGEITWVDQDGDVIRNFCAGHSHEELDAAQMRGESGVIAHPAVMLRRHALLDIGGYRVEMEPSEDFDLFLRLAERGRLANLDRVVLRYRIHSASCGGRRREAQNRNRLEALKHAHGRRGLAYAEASAPVEQTEQRPGDSERLWARWALYAGNVAMARKLAWASLRQSPLVRESWKMMACAIRGH